MEHFIDHLRAIERKPGLYLGRSPSLSHLFSFIGGFQSGRMCSDDTSVLDSFEFWVYHHYKASGAMAWPQIILEHAGGDEALAFRRFYEHLDEYLAERERLGSAAIKARYMATFAK